MGKIRVSTLGDTEAENKQKEEAKKRRLAKKTAKEGVKAAAVSEEKKETKKAVKESKKPDIKEVKKEEPKEKPKKSPEKTKKTQARVRSPRYLDLRKLVDYKKLYPVAEALTLVKETARTKFAGSVEAHFNLTRVLKIKNADGVKLERKTPLAHAKLGKTSDSAEQLQTTLLGVFKTLGRTNVKKLVVNASMGPGIKVVITE